MNIPTLYCDLDRGTLHNSSLGGARYDFPPTPAGGAIEFSLRFLLRDVRGVLYETYPALRQVRASVGLPDIRPEGGTYRLQVGGGAATGDNTTEELPHDANAAAVAAALSDVPLGGGPWEGSDVPGGMVLSRADGSLAELRARNNRLWPTALLRKLEYLLDDAWQHELRWTVAPISFYAGMDRLLPQLPSVSRVQPATGEFFFKKPEIHELSIPREFRGTFRLVHQGTATRALNHEDTIETIEDALNEILRPANLSCKVSLPESGRPHITYSPAGEPVPLLDVEVLRVPPPPPHIRLPLNTAETFGALRGLEWVDVEIELEADIWEPPATALAEPEVWVTRKLATTTLRVTRPQIWPGLETLPAVDWLQPPSSRDYTPFSRDNIITGQQHWVGPLGTETAQTFVLTHGLGTADLHVTLRRNLDGALLYPATATAQNENQLAITLGREVHGTAYTAVITSAGPASAFSAHTHTLEDVAGLALILDDLGSRLQSVEAILPSSGPGVTSTDTAVTTMLIPEEKEILFSRTALTFDAGRGILDPPPRAPFLLPAVHDATVSALPNPLPDPTSSTNLGQVWQNQSTAPILIPGGGGIRSAYVPASGYVACDGRNLYVVSKDGATNSFHPTAFDRTLFAFAVADKMLAIGRTMECNFAVVLHLAEANTKAQWTLQVEIGTINTQTSPAPVGLNLEAVTWGAPVIAQPIVVTRMAQSHSFGLRIRRRATELQLDRQFYGVWSGANAFAPATANFAVRARLTRFDTENVPAPRGWLGYQLTGAVETDDKGITKTIPAKVTIQ